MGSTESEQSAETDYTLTVDEVALLRTCRALDFIPTDRLDEVVDAGLAPVVEGIIAARLAPIEALIEAWAADWQGREATAPFVRALRNALSTSVYADHSNRRPEWRS